MCARICTITAALYEHMHIPWLGICT